MRVGLEHRVSNNLGEETSTACRVLFQFQSTVKQVWIVVKVFCIGWQKRSSYQSFYGENEFKNGIFWPDYSLVLSDAGTLWNVEYREEGCKVSVSGQLKSCQVPPGLWEVRYLCRWKTLMLKNGGIIYLWQFVMSDTS